MHVMTTSEQMRTWRKNLPNDCVLGFVPTMGHLHAGHEALLKAAKKKCDVVLASVFVNPLQFNDQKDFQTYPNTLEQDIKRLESIGADALFAPSIEEMYPHGHKGALTINNLPDFFKTCCGKHRPRHFEGVASVLCRLFYLTMPNVVVFGEKDYQQLCLVRYLIKDFSFEIEVLGVPTVRENNGLAMSSRNDTLTATARDQAGFLHKVMRKCAAEVKQNNWSKNLYHQAVQQLQHFGFSVQYLVCIDGHEMRYSNLGGHQKILLVAVVLENVRLIDNIIVS